MYQKNKLLTIVGLMSGTSMDGINATIIKTDGIDLIRCGINYIGKYSSKTVKYLKLASEDPLKYTSDQKKITELNSLVTFDHYNCVKNLLLKTKIIPELIGFHGQTIYHNSKKKISIQLGDGYLLSKLLKKDVICDFRSNDINKGGEGAPLAPIYHCLVMKQLNLKLPSCFINIGGVSNITYWDGKRLIGFDTGPGNGLMDGYMQKMLNLPYDESGSLASKGTINPQIVNFFLQNNYFSKAYPKSLDKNYFIQILELVITKKISHEDCLATLTECTVQSILLSLNQLPTTPNNIVIMGGGVYNKFLITKLKAMCKIPIVLSSDLNLPGEMIEAELIAYLSARSIYNYPITFQETTGTKKPISGGNYYSYKKPSESFE